MFRPALRTTRAFQAPSAAPKFPRRNFNTTKMRRDDHGGGRGMGIPEEGAFESIHHMPRQHAKAEWGPHIKNVLVTTAFWVPAMSIWTIVPYYARWAVNGHV